MSSQSVEKALLTYRRTIRCVKKNGGHVEGTAHILNINLINCCYV